jgi:hypothetical protein
MRVSAQARAAQTPPAVRAWVACDARVGGETMYMH